MFRFCSVKLRWTIIKKLLSNSSCLSLYGASASRLLVFKNGTIDWFYMYCCFLDFCLALINLCSVLILIRHLHVVLQVFFLCTYTVIEGGFGSFGFLDLANFGGGFSVFTLEICSFSVLVACAAHRFSSILVISLRILSKMITVFRIFLSHAFFVFFWFC